MKSTTPRLAIVAGIFVLGVYCAPVSLAQTQKSSKEMRESVDSHPAVKLQPLNLKTGLWESTRTIKRTGQLPIPAEMLNRLTPEQRARMQERIKANSAAHTSTATEKHCITKEDLESDRLKLLETKECSTTVLNSTPTAAKAKFVCDQEGMRLTGTLELVAADPEHVNGSYQSAVNGGGNTTNVDGTWTSKWLGPSCGNVR